MTPSQFRAWAVHQALPLWAGNGFDSGRDLFHERLHFNGQPITLPALRLMVQARQIATYSRAALREDYAAGEQALRCLHTVEQRYHRADGAPGWVFSLAQDGRPADCRRDLYAHAFILFAYAWAYRLSGDAGLRKRAWESSVELRDIFHAHNGGFLDAAPPYDTIRRQNPHMHLLEAYLALFEATEEEIYLNFATELVELGISRFIEPNTSLLLEDFDSEWKPLEPFGHNRAEPGHLFEWSWLLQEYLRLNAGCKDEKNVRHLAQTLHQTALVHTNGCVLPVIRDGISENGTVTSAHTRVWPQTEFMRSLAVTVPRQQLASNDVIASVLENFSIHYIPASLHGGWIDKLSADNTSKMDHMPASSLYHIYGAVCELSP